MRVRHAAFVIVCAFPHHVAGLLVDDVHHVVGNCFACHIKARPEWDLICEQDHGCDPLEITPKVISLIQQTDPRCEEQPTLSPEDQKILADFVAALSASQSAE